MNNAAKIIVQHAYTGERFVMRRVNGLHGWEVKNFNEGRPVVTSTATDDEVVAFVVKARESFFGQVFFEECEASK